MTSTTPFLLAGSNLPESSQLTDTANKNGLSPLAVSAQTDVETVVQEVLGFATALLEASEQVGKDLPLSGKTLPLDTNSLPTDEDATPIAVPLPLTDELEVRVLKPQEAAALLPVRTPEVAIDAAQRQQFEADVNVVVPSSPIVRESTPRTAEVSAQPLRNQNGRPGIQWIEPRTQPAESAPRLLTESDGLGDSRVVQSGLPLEAGSERKYLGSQTPTAAPLSPATSDPKTTAENALEFALTDNRQESLRGEVDTDTRLRLESHNHVIRRSLATQASLSINPLESTVAGLVSPTPAGPTAPLPLLTLPTTMVAPDGSLEPQWGQDFAERVGWVVHAKVPKAQLRLHPESLGPIELTIEADDQLARVQFSAAHPLTREAIEQSLPKLRAMLEQQGLTLDQADISGFDRSQQDGKSDADSVASDESNTMLAANTDQDTADIALEQRPKRGLIDTYV